jgi:hypothetical protein
MTEPQRWEYWWKTFTSDEKPKGFHTTMDQMMEEVQNRGLEGWELVNYAIEDYRVITSLWVFSCVMKRPITDS